ncbi:hypothetical protein GDO81_003193 [Engystomops pustulosus]|uniref:Uncharacterized protein n=1 Tax=Engystomops pustulosus TaxID=76066 RepID=A0AAV6ZUC7_ENGPU|nr:hypothetical protein GDO81_003193 [Engystomops pustulosus]
MICGGGSLVIGTVSAEERGGLVSCAHLKGKSYCRRPPNASCRLITVICPAHQNWICISWSSHWLLVGCPLPPLTSIFTVRGSDASVMCIR